MIPHCDFDLHFSDNEHLFVCLLATCMSSLEKCLFSFLVHFFIGFFIFLALSCMSCLFIFEINSLSVASFAIIFSHSFSMFFKGKNVHIPSFLPLYKMSLYFQKRLSSKANWNSDFFWTFMKWDNHAKLQIECRCCCMFSSFLSKEDTLHKN